MAMFAAGSISALALVAAMTGAAGDAGSLGKSVLAEIIAGSANPRSGKSPDPEIGSYVVVKVDLPTDDPRAIQKGRQAAMKLIGEYLGARVEAKMESGYKQQASGDGKAESARFFRDYSAIRVDMVLGAIEMVGLGTENGRSVAGFMLSEGAARRMQDISEQSAAALKAKQEGKPLEVAATGIAMIERGDVATARTKALESAKQLALEMAMGASVVGRSLMDRSETATKFRETYFSSTEGRVANYSIERDEPEGETFVVRIRATIQQDKLLEDYRAHLRSIGDPVFCVDACGNADLQAAANAFFKGKQFSIKEGADCAWIIRLEPSFTKRTDPQNSSRTGQQCLISATLVNARTREVLLQAGETARGFDSMDAGEEAQKRRAVLKAFGNMGKDLHGKIEEWILRVVREGRPVQVRIRGLDGIERVTTRLVEALSLRPGINDVKVGLEQDGAVVIDLKAQVASDLVVDFVAADACALAPAGAKPRLRKQADEEIVIDVEGAKPAPTPTAPEPPAPPAP